MVPGRERKGERKGFSRKSSRKSKKSKKWTTTRRRRGARGAGGGGAVGEEEEEVEEEEEDSGKYGYRRMVLFGDILPRHHAYPYKAVYITYTGLFEVKQGSMDYGKRVSRAS